MVASQPGQPMEKTSTRIIVDLLRKLGNDPDDAERKNSLLDELQKVTIIDLGRRMIGDKGIAALGNALKDCPVPRLERLSLEENDIGDEAMAAIGGAFGVGNLTSLKILHLSWNNIGEQGCKSLADGFLGNRQAPPPTPSAAVRNNFSFEFWNKKKSSKSRRLSTEISGFPSVSLSESESLNFTGNLSGNGQGWPGSIEFGDMGKRKTTFKTAPNLHTLWLSGNRIGDAGIAALASAFEKGHAPALKVLRLFKNEIKADGAESLGKALRSGHLPRMEALNLGQNPIGPDGTAALANSFSSQKFVALKEIGLSASPTMAAGCIALARAIEAGQLPYLESLYLHKNQIGNGGAAALGLAIASGHLKNLKVMDLECNRIEGAAGIQELANVIRLGHLPNLEILDLVENSIGTDGAKVIFEAFQNGKCRNLKWLALDGNYVGDEGCAALAKALELDCLKGLQRLYLARNNVTPNGLAAIVQAFHSGHLPNLSVLSIDDNQLQDQVNTVTALTDLRTDASPHIGSVGLANSTTVGHTEKAAAVECPVVTAYANNKDSKAKNFPKKPSGQDSDSLGEYDIPVSKTSCFNWSSLWCGTRPKRKYDGQKNPKVVHK